jgi:WD40 repeat protein
LLATGSYDGTIKLWDVATGAALMTFRGHQSFVKSVAFVADGRTLVSAARDRTVKWWDVP